MTVFALREKCRKVLKIFLTHDVAPFRWRLLQTADFGLLYFFRGFWPCGSHGLSRSSKASPFRVHPTKTYDHPHRNEKSWPGLFACRNVSGIFVALILEDFAGDFPGEIFGHFLSQKRRKDLATKSTKKTSGGSKLKIRERSILPKSDPARSEDFMPLSLS